MGLFIGATGRHEDFLDTLDVLEMLGLPAWVDWSLIVVGLALLVYGYWGRRQEEQGLDRAWSEEAAVKMLEVRLEHRREAFEAYLMGLAIVAVTALLLFGLPKCEGIRTATDRSEDRYFQCVKHSQAQDEDPAPCRMILDDAQGSH